MNKQIPLYWFLSIVYLNGAIISSRNYSRSLLVKCDRPNNAVVAVQRLHRVFRLQWPYDHLSVRSTIPHVSLPSLPRCQILLVRRNRHSSHPTTVSTISVLHEILLCQHIVADDGLVIWTSVQSCWGGEAQAANCHRVICAKHGEERLPLYVWQIVFLTRLITFTTPFLCPVATYALSVDYPFNRPIQPYNCHGHDKSTVCLHLTNSFECLEG